DVAEPPLEQVVLEDRGGTRCVVGGVDNLARLVDRPGRRETDRCVVVYREPSRRAGLAPDFIERTQQKGAGGAQPSLGLRDLRLDDIVVAQGASGAARNLVAGELDKGIERAAGDPERHPGKARGV